MSNRRLERQLDFILEIDGLKNIFRQSYLRDGRRKENSAEHSWHVAVMSAVLSEYADNDINQSRVMLMLLLHDIVEIDAGDTYCYDTEANTSKREREQLAAERIFGLLPEDQGTSLRALWKEFEDGASPDAGFAAALDRLMPLLHNYHTAGKSWQEHNVTGREVLERNGHIQKGSSRLWDLARSIIEKSIARGYLKP